MALPAASASITCTHTHTPARTPPHPHIPAVSQSVFVPVPLIPTFPQLPQADVDDFQLIPGRDELMKDDDDVQSVVIVEPVALSAMQGTLQKAGYSCVGRLANIANTVVKVTQEEMEVNLAAIDAIEECDDVDSVEHNMVTIERFMVVGA